MRSESPFRLSTYLTLGFACACLGYAEAKVFPEVGAFAAVVVLVLALLYRLEKRVELLSVANANKLGIGIALVCTAWAIYRAVRELRQSESIELSWQLLVFPLVGPFLLLLIPAKLLRREKHVGDWWLMHLTGLLAILLAGVMTEDATVFVLSGVYALCGVWSLTEFARDRATGAVPSVPSATTDAPTVPALAVGPPTGVARGFARGLFFAVVAAAAAVPLFLLTPRSRFEPLDFGKRHLEIGLVKDQRIDLNRTGPLESNPKPVFEVMAENLDGGPKTDLSPAQRWRSSTLSHYRNGSWVLERFQLPTASDRVRPMDPWSPPDLGPGMYRLTFTSLSEERTYALADPVLWVPGQAAPVASLCPDRPRGWQGAYDGSGTFLRVLCVPGERGERSLRYIQYACDSAEPDIGPGFELAEEPSRELNLEKLLANHPAGVTEYADRVLAEAIRDGRLPLAAAGRRSPLTDRSDTPDEYHEAIAREFSRHLRESPEFYHTTDLRRVHPNADPIVEFLFELKAGHCARYAAALVMMLRSQSIPAVVVLGYRGCEHLGDGRYVVRQEFAHAWVEALISRPAEQGKRKWHWLSLDPTPDRTADESATKQGTTWWRRLLATGRELLDKYVLNYSADRREQAMQAAARLFTSPTFLTALGAVVGLVVLARLLRRTQSDELRPQSDPEPTRWYGRLLAVLAAHGFAPQSGETPREFVAGVATALARRPATAPLAEVPLDWTEAYYQARFGGVPIAADRRAELESRLDQLARALR